MATTFVKIATVTVGSGGAANIQFTSIPSTYTDLCLRASTRGDVGNDYGQVIINGSTSGYTRKTLLGNGSGTASASFTSEYFNTVNPSTATASTFSNVEFYFPNYAGSTNKSVSTNAVTENNATGATALMQAVLWSNTAAITSLSLTQDGGNFVQYSTATLYGISKS
jgi:hypothetical protein